MVERKLGINEIARLAGVSRSTVSRVLTDNRNVNAETARKVKEVMRQYGYRPSILARGLATGKINIVALVVSDIRNSFYSELVWVISNQLREKGYLVSLYNCGHAEELGDDYIRMLLEYGFAGIMIADARNGEKFISMVSEAACPVVLLNREVEGDTGFDAVLSDNVKGGYLAGQHLAELGHQKIAMLTGPKNSASSMQRVNGFLQALAEHGIPQKDILLQEGDLTMYSGYGFACTLFAGKRPTVSAVFAANDMMAFGILDFCRENTVRVPEELSIIGYDDIPISRSTVINLTTIRQPYVQMGQIVAERLVARMKGEDGETQKITLPPKLILRESTAPYHI